ncbi:GRIP domain-containing protein [Teratosphaeria destructans]|uniref:GRIP domain-containing protein n=1 Tax=Teratosphaeria destructans TaxID=418781 RepID=A0A9W7W6R7_9PEZI|nr:GRIP domain-containing protein [Teratosphaeria destructans]
MADAADIYTAAKKKKKNKKKANGKAQGVAETGESNGAKQGPAQEQEDEDDEDEGVESPRKESIPNHVTKDDSLHMPSSPPEPTSPIERRDTYVTNGGQRPEDPPEPSAKQEPEAPTSDMPAPSDATARLDALQQERDSLRDQVTKLRQSLESLQQKHDEEVSGVKEELEQTQQGKDHAETQYKNLLGKVNTIRAQLGERLKQDAEELDQARARIEELEVSNNTAKEENERLQEQMSTLNTQMEEQSSELESLRSRASLSTSNWAKERDDMVAREAFIREEYEVAKQAMQDWEILATEERSRREVLEERIGDLEEQLNVSREAYERVRGEVETQSSTVDGLQRALREMQEERKRELREMVESSTAQLEELRKQAKSAEDSANELRQQLESARKELDRALPFEKEVKEKNLLIGKLRHEAVILNDHLTKALRFLKRGKPEDNVDRQLVTNHFLHFLALDRSDPKKFQVLQLIAALLGWNEEQKEQAGLLRAGSNAGSLKLPMSPYRRSPSTPSLHTEFVPEIPGAGASRESLAELWSEFLAREAEAGAGERSRRSSVRSTSLASQGGAGNPVGGRGPPLSPALRRAESGGQSGKDGK